MALFDPDGGIVARAFEPTEVTLSAGGGAEADPERWWSATVAATRRVVTSSGVDRDAVAAISVTGQWSGTVAVDAAGAPLMNAITWMDHRGAPYVDAITRGFPSIEGYGAARLRRWIKLTGGAPGKAGKDPIAHILFVKHAHPEVYAATHRFLEPTDYLNLKLTGRFVASYDSIALHWVTDNRDPDDVRYDDTLLGYAGIDRSKLPELVPATAVLGPVLPAVARELGIGDAAVVVAGTPDVQSAGIGSGAVADFAGHLYVGTSSWISCHVPFKKTDLRHNMASLPSPLPGRYFLADEQETAGACLTYLAENVFHGDDALGGAPPADVYRRFDAMAASVAPGAGGVTFMPWLYGERTPVEDRWVRAGFFNQSLETNRTHMVRAVFEGVAFNTRWLLFHVEKFIGRRLDPLVVVGGGATSEVWCRIFADVLDRTIVQATDPVAANLRGAAILARLALGEIGEADVPAMVAMSATFRPDPATRARYDAGYATFRDLYRANRRIYRRTNRGTERGGS